MKRPDNKEKTTAMTPSASKPFRFLPQAIITATLSFFDRVSIVFVRLGIGPNLLSTFGLLAGMAVGLFYALARPGWAAAFIIVCGVFDILDGKVAINANKKSKFGAIYDSSLDRYSEFFMYMGLAYYFRHHWAIWVIFLTFLGSTMVSYTRARAEGLGIECRVGIMQRAERLILLFTGTFFGLIFHILAPALIAALAIIALISNVTAVQRIFHVWVAEKRDSRAGSGRASG